MRQRLGKRKRAQQWPELDQHLRRGRGREVKSDQVEHLIDLERELKRRAVMAQNIVVVNARAKPSHQRPNERSSVATLHACVLANELAHSVRAHYGLAVDGPVWRHHHRRGQTRDPVGLVERRVFG